MDHDTRDFVAGGLVGILLYFIIRLAFKFWYVIAFIFVFYYVQTTFFPTHNDRVQEISKQSMGLVTIGRVVPLDQNDQPILIHQDSDWVSRVRIRVTNNSNFRIYQLSFICLSTITEKDAGDEVPLVRHFSTSSRPHMGFILPHTIEEIPLTVSITKGDLDSFKCNPWFKFYEPDIYQAENFSNVITEMNISVRTGLPKKAIHGTINRYNIPLAIMVKNTTSAMLKELVVDCDYSDNPNDTADYRHERQVLAVEVKPGEDKTLYENFGPVVGPDFSPVPKAFCYPVGTTTN